MSSSTINSYNPINPFYLINPNATNVDPKLLPGKGVHTPYFEGRRVETYTDILENLTPPQREAIEMKLNHVDQGRLKDVCEALAKGDITAPITQMKNFSFYCLLALREQLIDGQTYTTSQLFLNVLNRLEDKSKAEIVSLFIGEAINPRAWNLIQETLKPFPDTQYQNETKKSNAYDPCPRMTPEQLKTFFDLMRRLPPLERQFILIPDPNPIGKLKTPTKTITVRIQLLFHSSNALCRVSDKEGEPKRINPSKGMYQALLIAKHEEYAPTLITNYNLADIVVLKNGIPRRERPFCLDPTPEMESILPPVPEADGFPCDIRVNESGYHDGGYHGDVFGDTKDDQMRYYAVGQICEDIAKEMSSPEASELAKMIADKIYDMDNTAYKIFGKVNLPFSDRAAPFWYVITRRLNGDKFTNERGMIINEIFHKLIEQADQFKEKYDLTLESFIQVNFSKYAHIVTQAQVSTKNLFQGVILQAEAVSSLIERVEGKKMEELIQLSKHPTSYLLRTQALKQLRKKVDQTNRGTFISLSQKSPAAFSLAAEMFMDDFHRLRLTYEQRAPSLVRNLREKVQYHPKFEYYIKTAVIKKDSKLFDFLMTGDEFRQKTVNRVFDDGMTLLQTALYNKSSYMVKKLLDLGATPFSIAGQVSHAPIEIAIKSRNRALINLINEAMKKSQISYIPKEIKMTTLGRALIDKIEEPMKKLS